LAFQFLRDVFVNLKDAVERLESGLEAALGGPLE